MRVYIQGRQKREENLTDRDYITEGGEGRIYGKHGIIYKLYFDSKKIIPKAKIDELKKIDRPNILCPQDIILNKKLVPIGITMKWVKNVEPICKLFSNDFKKRLNIKPENIVMLVERLAKDIKFIHDNNCLIVDGNEMNYLVDSKTFLTPYFIDVDSYQTSHFPATAISPAIKDYHSKRFSNLSDWFSFAIIATQLFIGIHPYKGTHPKYKKYELEKRMRDNVSIFNSKVKLPASVRDFSYIPKNYMDWFIKLFEKGERTVSPSVAGQVFISVKVKTIKSTNLFTIELIREVDDDIIDYNSEVIFTKDWAYLNKLEKRCTATTKVLFTKQSLTPFFVDIKNNRLELEKFNGELIPCNIHATDKTFINDMLFVLMNDLLCEVDIEEMNSKFIPVIKSTWNILPNSTKMFNGIVYQDILGMPCLVIPYKLDNGKTACRIQMVKELKRYKILEAKHDNQVVMIIGYKNNKYTRFILKFSNDYTVYNCRKEEDVRYHIPNFVTLSNNIVICITPDDTIEIFNKRLDKNDIKKVEDKDINFDMKLCKKGIDVLFRKNKKLFKISMNK